MNNLGTTYKTNPADYIIYKGKAAAQFSLKRGEERQISPGVFRVKPGVVFLAVAPSVDEKKYNWEEKITLGLSVHELGKVRCALRGLEQKFFHDRYMGTEKQGQETKSLAFIPEKEGSIWLNISEFRNKEQIKKYSLKITRDECQTLDALLVRAIPSILGW